MIDADALMKDIGLAIVAGILWCFACGVLVGWLVWAW